MECAFTWHSFFFNKAKEYIRETFTVTEQIYSQQIYSPKSKMFESSTSSLFKNFLQFLTLVWLCLLVYRITILKIRILYIYTQYIIYNIMNVFCVVIAVLYIASRSLGRARDHRTEEGEEKTGEEEPIRWRLDGQGTRDVT